MICPTFEHVSKLHGSCKQDVVLVMKEFSTKINTCPFFERCSGCSIKDINTPPLWDNIYVFFKSLNKSLDPKLITGDFKGSRYRAKLAIGKNNDTPAIGLYKAGSHEVIDIPSCHVHHEAINLGVEILKKAINKFNVSIYLEKTGKGLLRYIQLFVQRETKKIQLSIVVNTTDMKEIEKEKPFFDYLFNKYDVFHSIWINMQDKNTNVIFSDKWALIHGEKYLCQKIGKVDLFFHPMSFAQSNVVLFEKMVLFLEKYFKENFSKNRKMVLELYAGIGAIGLNIADKTKKMTLVERNPFSKLFFDLTAQKQRFENVLYLNMDVGEVDNEINENEIIIVDPPRKGLDKKLLKALSLKKEGIIIYVSCFFNTFKKDSNILFSNSWKLIKGDGYLFFPGTNHVEILAIFEKKSG